MEIKNIKTPNDVLEYMKTNIKYGWLDINDEEHIGNMKNFRRLYRTSSLEEIIEHKIGTCIEQVLLMHTLLDNIDVPNKMFCSRIYEGKDFDKLEEDEHMHCFLLFYKDGKVFQLEHPNWEKIGIYEYKDEDTAIKNINDYYVNMSGGIPRPVTEFFDVPKHLNFKEFNMYINELENYKKNSK